MASANTFAAHSSTLFHSIYQGKDPAYTALKISKFLSEIKRTTTFVGADKKVTVKIAEGAGVSANHAKALAGRGPMLHRRFSVTRAKLYAIASIDGEAIAAARSAKDQRGAQIDMVKYSLKDCNERFMRRFSEQIWSVGGGAVTRFTAAGTTVTNAYFTCDPVSDAAKFQVGAKYCLSTDTGTGAAPAGLLDGGSTLEVSAVNLDTGVVTFTAAINTVAGASNTNYVFPEGDYGESMTGVRGWLPVTAPTSGDSFFGVDRSVHVTRLAGMRYSGGGGLKIDTIVRACGHASLQGANPSRCYVSPDDWSDISNEISAKEWVELPNADRKLGHKGLSIETQVGQVILVSEAYAPKGYFNLLNLDDWSFESAGDFPQVLDYDKLAQLHRDESSDSCTYRSGGYGNLICENPGNQLLGTF